MIIPEKIKPDTAIVKSPNLEIYNLIGIINDYLNSCPSFWKEYRKGITDIPCDYFKDYKIVCCREVEHYGSMAKDGCAITILEKESKFYINVGSAKINAPAAYKELNIVLLEDYLKSALDRKCFDDDIYAVLYYFLNQIILQTTIAK